MCEFFYINELEEFQVWNMSKKTSLPAHVIKFKEKHNSDENRRLYKISSTCPDQSFFTVFVLKDLTVNLYLMNFKKGSMITKDKLLLENNKSLKIL
mmetsp:Transcript_4407/g.7487  ORF Transcript_4407/g.7487 Transcript_4407/m.7487 type:complete len:96 (+) Transcript_4407:2611-2898(+)